MSKSDVWKADAIRLKQSGLAWGELPAAIEAIHPGVVLNAEQIRNALRYNQEYRAAEKPTDKFTRKSTDKPPANVQETLMQMLGKGATSQEIADRIGVTPKIVAAMVEEKIAAGFNVRQAGETWKIDHDLIPSENHVRNEWDGSQVIRFGLMGDTQINSKYTQLTHLHRLYDVYAQEGISTVYHTGDIDEGEQMRKGHQYECYNQGVDDHVDEIVANYPLRDGITTHFVTGNHDASMLKLSGVNIGTMIAHRRPDMQYLGQDSAVIQLTDNCTLELRHPGDGTAYALSYKLQKMIEAMSGGEKPNILAVGHYHKQEQLFYRNVHAFQTACLQAQTPWMRGKQISAVLGGWLLELRLNCDGGIERIKSEFFPFYTAIKDDYKNWR